MRNNRIDKKEKQTKYSMDTNMRITKTIIDNNKHTHGEDQC